MNAPNYELPSIEEYRKIPAFVSFRDWVAQTHGYSEASARYAWVSSGADHKTGVLVREWLDSLTGHERLMLRSSTTN